VKTHRLNELWPPDGGKDERKNFSSWLKRAGAKYTTGTYGVHIADKKRHNKVYDTFLCYSGPGVTQPPSSRGLPFKLMDISKVEMLTTPGERAHDRVVRLVRREHEKRTSGKKQDTGPSPTKRRPSDGDGSDDDEEEDDGSGGNSSSHDSEDDSGDGAAAAAAHTPWLKFSKKTLFTRSARKLEQKQTELDDARCERDDARAARADMRRERDEALQKLAAAQGELDSTVGELGDARSARASALAENAQLRAREDVLMRRLKAAQQAALATQAELHKLREGELAVRADVAEKLAAQRADTIRSLRKELGDARSSGLEPLDAPASSDMLESKMERSRARAPLRRVLRAAWPLRIRMRALTDSAKHWFGAGWLWVFALVLSRHAEGMRQLMSFARPFAYVQNMITRGVRRFEREPATADRAFLTRLAAIIGRKKWEQQRRDLKYTCEVLAADGDKVRFKYTQRQIAVGVFQMKQIDDMCSRHQHKKARQRLVERYSHIWDFTETDDGDTIERLYVDNADGTRDEVGAYIDVYGVALICIKSGLEFEEFHPHVNWVVRWDEDGPVLYIVIGDGCDEYPRTRRHTSTEGSLSNRLEFGAACSPPRQFPYLSVDAKETGAPTVWALDKKEIAVSRLRSSLDPKSRITLNVRLPRALSPVLRVFIPDAPIGPVAASHVPLPTATTAIRCAIDYLPIFDIKHHAFCNKNSGTSGLYGGITYSGDNDNLCLPEAKLLSRADYMKDEKANYGKNYFVHDKDYIAKCVRECSEFMDEWRAAHPPPPTDANAKVVEKYKEAAEKAAKEHCAQQQHSWWHESMPYDFVSLVFFCVLHLDTNLGAVWIELYEAYTKQLASSRGFEYTDERSPHNKFHKALEQCDMEPIARRFRNRIPPTQDPQDFRLLGPHVIDAMRRIYLFDAEC
jgi:hypothetical protein